MWSVGGYIGSEYQWEYFEEEWPKVLEIVGIPYFHMKETAKPNGIFSKWHPPQEHTVEWATFYANLATVISNSHIFGICLSFAEMTLIGLIQNEDWHWSLIR